jgi:hypothetical protein
MPPAKLLNYYLTNNFVIRLYKAMFKEINSGLVKFFTRDKIIIVVILFVLGYILMAYSRTKSISLDGMGDGSTGDASTQNIKSQPTVKDTAAQNYVQPPSGMSQNTGFSPYDTASPSDLLPKDGNSEWSKLNPVANGSGVVMPDLLQAGYHIGLDTIGQTLRNANQQLRSDPIIPKQETGPWLQSTIEPDLGRAPLEIGN